MMGAPTANGNSRIFLGCIRVYHMNDSKNDWIQIGVDVDGEVAGDRSGWSVCLSVDGNKVVIRSPYNDDNSDRAGHVRVFVLE
ncbi:hypothetical protein ACHAXA_008804 [Cyclostephanos tholiformis]|uniref:Uncharacterized protein n=1 Tax=Cyclostephanos tholiformis TaxID=382380 RepID=A0ABD3R0I0_9STRA